MVDGDGAAEGGRRVWFRRTPKPRRKAPWWELPLLIVVVVAVALLVKSLLFQPFSIPSASMENTLLGHPGHHDRVLVSKISVDFRDPRPGDIVVFRGPAGWPAEASDPNPSTNPVVKALRDAGRFVGVVPPATDPLIKRVIAVGGQTVKCCDAQGRVQVADSPTGPFRSLVEPYTYVDPGGDGSQTFGPVTVPAGKLWMMGDHRNDSDDSRFRCGDTCTDANDQNAFVPVKNVVGKAILIAWPVSRWRTLGTPATFTAAAGALGPLGIGSATALLVAVPARRRRRR